VLGAVLVLAVVAVVLAVAVPRAGQPPGPDGAPSTSGSEASPSATVQPAATALVNWVSQQLPAGAHLVADRSVVAELRRAGAPSELVSEEGDASSPGTSSTLTVTGGAVPAAGRLVARFGTPVALAVVDPSPQEPTADELARRRELATAVLANPTTRTGGSAAAQLRAGAVDPRLLSVLAVLAARSGVGIATLPADAAEPPDIPLARSALVDEVGGRPVSAGTQEATDLVALLRAQLAPYAPDRIAVTTGGVLIAYRYLSAPDAAVTAASH
jgi:hypothetical protein